PAMGVPASVVTRPRTVVWAPAYAANAPSIGTMSDLAPNNLNNRFICCISRGDRDARRLKIDASRTEHQVKNLVYTSTDVVSRREIESSDVLLEERLVPNRIRAAGRELRSSIHECIAVRAFSKN